MQFTAAPLLEFFNCKTRISNTGGDMKFPFVALIATVLAFAGCSSGGGGSTDVTTDKTTVVVGKFDAPQSTAIPVSIVADAAGDPITVHVLSDPSITTT